MEYTDSKVPIIVSNLPVNNDVSFLLSNRNDGKIKQYDMSEGLSKLEGVFLDIVDILTMKSLSSIDKFEFYLSEDSLHYKHPKFIEYAESYYEKYLYQLDKEIISSLAEGNVIDYSDYDLIFFKRRNGGRIRDFKN